VVLPSQVTEFAVDVQVVSVAPEQEIHWPDEEAREQNTDALHPLLASEEKSNSPLRHIKIETHRVVMALSFRT
jgi:hypothetical protein